MARTKDTITYMPKAVVTGFNLYGDGDVTPVSGTVKNAFEYSNTVTFGDNVRNWKRRIRRNESATTTLSGTKYEDLIALGPTITSFKRNDSPNAFEVAHPHREYSITPDSTHYYSPSAIGLSSVNVDEADNAAKADFLKRLIRHNRQVSGGVVLGELRETLRMIRNPAKELRRRWSDWDTASRKMRARRLRGFRGPTARRVRDVHRDLADSWLEHSFGWRPLLSDIDDATRALNRRNEYVGDPQPIFGEGGRNTQLQNSVAYLNGQGCRIYHNFIRERVTHVEYFGKTRAYVLNPLKFNARLWGFDPRDFAPTIWELTPYSFLIDYFTNIGTIIEAWSWGRADLAWCEKRVLRQYSNTRTYWSIPSASNFYDVGSSSGGFTTNTSHKIREPYGGGFTPAFTWKLPGFGLKWLNIAALVAAKRRDRGFKIVRS